MRKITLIIFFLIANILNSQNVYEIFWEQGINSNMASPVIEIGDTVKWIWSDASQKSVTSLPSGKESFDSGMIGGLNKSFSYTFSKTGVTEYENESNPNMSGKVTVMNKLSTEDKFIKNLSFYPNPVRNYLTISSLFKINGYQIYNVLGSMVAEGSSSGRKTTIDMTQLNSGLYFVKVVSGNMQSTLKIAKN
ncbi:T9SS type A sorting domain-containing protein [Aequorivita sp. H23M31]|uniref:T9SS type A sorting domain-containing protein n=1 Tax=Aequorivita ciconiae TaxID=2494375 RepID=A0A410G6Z7_9FLAO|nr:T9SS type A sorting domain-containing protein [Aequorivita sp. H23M31]QAA83057.1 T9SS type A sorting domain-containing protein [Aequorivita sp. H23M31]